MSKGMRFLCARVLGPSARITDSYLELQMLLREPLQWDGRHHRGSNGGDVPVGRRIAEGIDGDCQCRCGY